MSARFLLDSKIPSWLEPKGYLHITSQIDVNRSLSTLIKKITNKNFVSTYAFYPLIHSIIKERRFKKINNSNQRAHSFKNSSGNIKKTAKERPLHYATHLDSLIFKYYAWLLQESYESELSKQSELNKSIIAYRKIPISIGNSENKSTIHFAQEVFEEIKARSKKNETCVALSFDIESFFSSLDHELLKYQWSSIIGLKSLPSDHYNVFNATTRFSYILLDDLRKYKVKIGKKAGFDEKELARIRNKFGINAFFESPRAFREKIKSGKLKVYKFPFRNKDGKPKGIPQGLPISAVLANLYLLDFDKKIIAELVQKNDCFYRRYSDDIVILCNIGQIDYVKKLVLDFITENKVEISESKTETIVFRNQSFGKKNSRLTSIKKTNSDEIVGYPFVYLGFQFNGKNILIKSANLSKFYRRMISSVKRKARRAIKICNNNDSQKSPVIFRRQLYALYSNYPLSNTKIRVRRKRLVKIETGEYRIVSTLKKRNLRSNYFTYVKRASLTMNEPAIVNQLKKHSKIFNQAIHRALRKE